MPPPRARSRSWPCRPRSCPCGWSHRTRRGGPRRASSCLLRRVRRGRCCGCWPARTASRGLPSSGRDRRHVVSSRWRADDPGGPGGVIIWASPSPATRSELVLDAKAREALQGPLRLDGADAVAPRIHGECPHGAGRRAVGGRGVADRDRGVPVGRHHPHGGRCPGLLRRRRRARPRDGVEVRRVPRLGDRPVLGRLRVLCVHVVLLPELRRAARARRRSRPMAAGSSRPTSAPRPSRSGTTARSVCSSGPND